MRMPIFSYFLVVGSVLIGLLLWFGNEGVPNEMTSHIITNGRHPQVQTRARGRACQSHGRQFCGPLQAFRKKIGEDCRGST